MTRSESLVTLTDRQAEVLAVVIRFIEREGWPPQIPDLMPLLGVTSNRGVTQALDVLERKGHLERGTGRLRVLLDADRNPVRLRVTLETRKHA